MASPSSTLRFHLRTDAPAVVLAVSGRYEHGDFDVLKRKLDAASAQVGPGGALVVDVSDLSRLTSSALRAMMQTQMALTDVGARFAVAGARGVVREVFAISQMDQLIRLVETVADGLRGGPRAPDQA